MGRRTRSSPSGARRSWPPSRTISTPRRRGPRCSSSSPRATGARSRARARRCRSCCPCSGSSRCWRTPAGADAGGRGAARRARSGPGGARLRPGRRAARPACRHGVDRSRHVRGREARALDAVSASGAEIVYGRRPVAEAKRGRRMVRRVWSAPETEAGELTRLAGSPDHQGIVAEVDPYPYADAAALLDQPDGLIIALDQVQDPHNLGAVARSAEAAGAAGLVIPGRRAASVTPAAVKASAGATRAPADRQGVEPRRVARAAPRTRAPGSTGPRPTRPRRTRRPT